MFKKRAGILSVALCYILVGSSYPIAKEAMDSIPTWTFTFITFVIGFLVLLPLTLTSDKTNWFRIDLKNWLAISIQSMFGAVLYTVFLLYGLSSTSAISASVITSAAPAVVLVLSVIFLKEKMHINTLLSVVLAVVSVVLMTLPSSQSGSVNTFSGLVFLSLSTLSTAIVVVAAKLISSSMKPLTLAAGVCLTGAIFSIPMTLHELSSFNLSSITLHQSIIMVYYGIFVWALPYIFFFYGISRVSAPSAGMCVALIPVASMLASVMIYGDRVKNTDLIAMAIIIISILLSEFNLSTLFQRKRISGVSE